MLPTFSQNVILQEGFETATRINKGIKIKELDGAFCQKIKLLINRFSAFFAECRISVEKMIHQKKNRGHQTSKIVKSRQSYSNGHLPYHLLFLLLSAGIDV